MSRLALTPFMVLVVGGGLLIGLFTVPGPWYEALVKPSFDPPNWIFGPVWTVLYILIAIAGWRIWQRDRSSPAMKLWWLQLLLNFCWSPAFFALRQTGLALAVIVALLLVILAFIAAALKVDRPSALLFVPYAAWVGFATLLNAAIWQLN
ncbi:MAG: tryptophan-rich sensory protein [Rhizobiaceae bacterium]|nr:tryptophan-rich sensory protein [Rhizobiaceae bacterium]